MKEIRAGAFFDINKSVVNSSVSVRLRHELFDSMFAIYDSFRVDIYNQGLKYIVLLEELKKPCPDSLKNTHFAFDTEISNKAILTLVNEHYPLIGYKAHKDLHEYYKAFLNNFYSILDYNQEIAMRRQNELKALNLELDSIKNERYFELRTRTDVISKKNELIGEESKLKKLIRTQRRQSEELHQQRSYLLRKEEEIDSLLKEIEENKKMSKRACKNIVWIVVIALQVLILIAVFKDSLIYFI